MKNSNFFFTFLKKQKAFSLTAFLFFSISAVLCIAYYYQYVLHVMPCNLCVLERVPYMLSLPFLSALLFLYHKRIAPLLRYIFFTLILILMLANIILSLFHMGVEHKLWSSSQFCNTTKIEHNLTNEDLLKSLNKKIVPQCSVVQIRILHLSLTSWNAFISFIFSILATYALFLEKREMRLS